MHGADSAELRRLAVEFRTTADELDRESGLLSHLLNNVTWLGGVADRFVGGWSSIQLPRINLSTNFLREAADKLDANAREQDDASAGPGGAGGAWGSPHIWPRPEIQIPYLFPGYPPPGSFDIMPWGLGGAFPPIAGIIEDYGGPLLGALGDVHDSMRLKLGGWGIGAIGTITGGVQLIEDIAGGRPGDAAAEAGLLAGDSLASVLKMKASPQSYAVGVVVQTWTEVARAAREIDWSLDGLSDLLSASPGDVVGALGEGFREAASKLPKIFGF